MANFIWLTHGSGVRVLVNADHISMVRPYDGPDAGCKSLAYISGDVYYEIRESVDDIARLLAAE